MLVQLDPKSLQNQLNCSEVRNLDDDENNNNNNNNNNSRNYKIVVITKLAEYVDRKEDPLIQVVRTHQHNADSAVLQAARCPKTEEQKETRKMKDRIAQKRKERWHGKRMHGQLPRNLTKSWWTLNSHIAG